MKRKLFCETGPVCYGISVKKEQLKRSVRNLTGGGHFARGQSSELLPVTVKAHSSLLLRSLTGVDMRLQLNRVTNIILASRKLSGIVIRPGETFSFWKSVGRITKKRGYTQGLVIGKNGLGSGLGGGLCQLANMIHWLVLNSPLTVTELHNRQDSLFLDDRRHIPFGTGTLVLYNYLDYRFVNTTDQSVQLSLWVDGEGELFGELRSEREFPYRYRLVEENHHFRREEDGYYRISQVYRLVIRRETGVTEKKELVLDNHSLVMYDPKLIPRDQIRDD